MTEFASCIRNIVQKSVTFTKADADSPPSERIQQPGPTWLPLDLCASIDAMSNSAAPFKPTSHILSMRLLTLLLLLAAFALRLYRLGSESLWYDETVSAFLAGQSPGALLAHTARDIHPPAYYLLLQLWDRLATPTPAFGLEFLLAWPSVWFGLLTLALTFAVARRWLGNRGALVALAVASVQPFQVWSAQEVRMYALGALCLLLTLWAVTPWLRPTGVSTEPSRRRLVAYILAAALGLYTLYYFLFWLLVLNACLIFCLGGNPRQRLRWGLTQISVFILWLPWFPIFMRQAITPPVPVWRLPWHFPTDLAHALVEGLSAQLTAHIQPFTLLWPWALVVGSLYLLFYVYTKNNRAHLLIWLSLAPFGLLLLISSLGPPLYHVRYLATYAPIFPLVIATLFTQARPARPPAFTLSLLLLIAAVAALTLHDLWRNPRYAADNHRQAVADLAAGWRPGDAILVNAGWVYTAIAVYWPQDLPTPQASLPPAIRAFPRLTDATQFSPHPAHHGQPVVYRTGSIDGPDTLGWGQPESDFFSMSVADTQTALQQVDQTYDRLWHYRLYDTVSDPNGDLRAWLAAQHPQTWDQTYPGPGFLRLERYTLSGPSHTLPPEAVLQTFEEGVTLRAADFPATHSPGAKLYVDTVWQVDAVAPPNLAVSLRLYTAAGERIAQYDAALPIAAAGDDLRLPLALPVPAATPPGDYRVALILYDATTLAPLAHNAPDTLTLDTARLLGTVTIRPAP